MSEQNLIIPEAKRQKTKTLIDVMIDIETQSTKYNASIVAIAAIKFDPFTYIENWTINEIDEKNKIEILIDLEDSKRYNLDIDESTMTWWSRQPESVRKRLQVSHHAVREHHHAEPWLAIDVRAPHQQCGPFFHREQLGTHRQPEARSTNRVLALESMDQLL